MLRNYLALCLVALTFFGSAAGVMAQEGVSGNGTPLSVGLTQTSQNEKPPAYVLTRDGSPDYDSWGRLATRVEQALEVGRASDKVLRDLRAELNEWRALFSKAQSQHSVRIHTLKTQITTLGPVPEDERVEPTILSQRRAELTEELNAAQAPVEIAEEAYSRADVLIREIDSLMRSRQADLLLELGPTPLNPALWRNALSDLLTSLNLARTELSAIWGSDAQLKDFKQDFPITLVLLIVGFVLLIRARHWVMQTGTYLRRRRHGASRGVVGFVVSLGQVAAPLLGIYALIEALNLSGILGLRGQVIADALPAAGAFVFGSLWLANRVFGIEGASWTVIEMPTSVARAEAKANVALMGVMLAIWVVLTRLSDHETYAAETRAVLQFPILVLVGVLLVRMGRLLHLHAKMNLPEEQAGNFRANVMHLVSTLTTLVGFAGPILAAVGYSKLSAAFLFPWIMTLGVLALLEVLHRFFVAIYGTIRGQDETEARLALWPILTSFIVAIAALPLLALIWGARTTDLTELWTIVMGGIQLGDARITPRTFMVFAMIFVVGYTLTRLLQSMLKTSILPKTKMDIGGQNAISAGVGYVGIFLAALIAITSAGLDLSSVAIVAGALSVGIGFGLQNIVSNFISGIILLVERPISEGDWIEVGGQMGYVRDISVRSTRIETFDRSDVILPNSDLISGVVTNYTRGNSIGRIILPVGVAYGTDTKRVEEVLREIVDAHPMVTVEPPPSVLFVGFGADSLDFEIRAILRDVNFSLSVKSELNHEIARRFVEEGFEIPFAQRDLWIRNPEALRPEGPREKPPSETKAKKTVTDSFTLEDMQDTADDGVVGDADE
ncbi:DUF3772 domain-containing protein [Aliiroseovarius sp. KMU-50]|uniref:DUF3772 domain-containing protein n=1 Tax=Aliiroseovarius salicola TaxID=3009082 RepID=A0ABT4W2D1_9RHOB|nr:DUF3772 domain-containing protein [Aliiroseovarius sp. KMU-50]MDA5094679.1 DUF3772 domain-containing protein [Aliiroseovarius sp. KMU-50]